MKVRSLRVSAGPQKGPAERGHVKKSKKSSKSVKNIFDTFRQFSRRAKNVKIVKKCQYVFRHFSTIFARHQFSGPFWGGSECVAFRLCIKFPKIALEIPESCLDSLTFHMLDMCTTGRKVDHGAQMAPKSVVILEIRAHLRGRN